MMPKSFANYRREEPRRIPPSVRQRVLGCGEELEALRL
jgi:hypothetical protein